MMIFLQNASGHPLMPTTRTGMIRQTVTRGDAQVVSHFPFVVQLKTLSDSFNTQPLILGIDPGNTIGIAVITPEGIPILFADLATRSQEIPGLMEERAMHRRSRRHHARMKRIRRANAAGTIFQENSRKFHLPGTNSKDEPLGSLSCHSIKPKLSKFANRKRDEKWLTPTCSHLLWTHVHFIESILKLLPITQIVIEYAAFDFQRLNCPGIEGEQYQQGPLLGYENAKQYVLERDHHLCQWCKKKTQHYLHVHHVIWKRNGGADSSHNLVTLCLDCHDLVHTSAQMNTKLVAKFEGIKKRYPAATQLNTILPGLYRWLLTSRIPVKKTYGYITKYHRKNAKIEKSHVNDAYFIAASRVQHHSSFAVPEDLKDTLIYHYAQFRRHNTRQIITRVEDRKYYQQDPSGKLLCVAKNRRNGRTGQKEPSLQDFQAKYGDRAISQLIMKKGKKAFRDFSKTVFHPGDIVYYEGQRKVVKGTSSKGSRVGFVEHKNSTEYVPSRKCRLVRKNTGIVCIACTKG